MHIPRPKFDIATPNEFHQADLPFLPHDKVRRKTYVCPHRGRRRDQGIVERFNRTLAERLFGHQYAQEMWLPSGQKSSEWVVRLPTVVAALNEEVTRLTGKMPKDAIKAMSVAQKPSSTIPGRQVDLKEQKFPSGVAVRYLYQPGELKGGRLRATDPVWSLQVYRLGRSVTKQRVRICIQKLTALSILRFHLVVVKAVHEMLGEVEDTQVGVHRPVEKQMTFAHLNSRKVIIKDLGPCKGWAGNKAPELVFLFFFLRTSLTSTRLRRFTIVTPKIEFFISLYRSFSSAS